MSILLDLQKKEECDNAFLIKDVVREDEKILIERIEKLIEGNTDYVMIGSSGLFGLAEHRDVDLAITTETFNKLIKNLSLNTNNITVDYDGDVELLLYNNTRYFTGTYEDHKYDLIVYNDKKMVYVLEEVMNDLKELATKNLILENKDLRVEIFSALFKYRLRKSGLLECNK